MSASDEPLPSPEAPSASVTQRAAVRRNEIRDAVLVLLQEELARGSTFDDVSIDRITAGGGVSRSTFYSYFTDRSDLLRACASHVFGEALAAVQAWWEIEDDPTREAVRTAVTAAIRAYLPRAPLMAAIHDAARNDRALAAEINAIMDGLTRSLAAQIAADQARGFVDPELLPLEAAELIIWMFERTQHQVLAGAGGAELERLIDGAADVVWRALYAPGRAR